MLRDYQAEDLAKIREAAKGGARRILFEASVGYGKSVVIQTMAAAYAAQRRPVWVFSNRSAVVDQLAKRAAGMPSVQVMTIQAADKRREELARNPAHLILVDELHMGGSAAQYGRVLDCSPAALAVGFTGTPSPANFDTFPCYVQGRSSRWLTDRGFLAPLRYVAPSTLDLGKIGSRNGEFDERQVMAVLEESKLYGHSIEAYRAYGLGVPTLGFCVNVKHAHATAEDLRKAGHRCEVLVGGDSKRDTAYKIDFLSDGGLVAAVDRLTAGFDLPHLRVIQSWRPTASPRTWHQQMGRVARAFEGKDYGLVVDQVGNVWRHGVLTQTVNWRGGGKGKMPWAEDHTHTADGECLAVRQCPSCASIFETGPSKCPSCGSTLARDTRISRAESVRLEEVKAEEVERRQQENAALRKRLGQSIAQMRTYLGHRTAVENMRKRLDKALRNGDDLVADFARKELRQAGAL